MAEAEVIISLRPMEYRFLRSELEHHARQLTRERQGLTGKRTVEQSKTRKALAARETQLKAMLEEL